MNAKDTAKQVIDTLPKTVTMNHALNVTTRFERGVCEVRDMKGVSDKDARLRLKKLKK